MKPEIQFIQLFINNEFVPAFSGRAFATIDPSDETDAENENSIFIHVHVFKTEDGGNGLKK